MQSGEGRDGAGAARLNPNASSFQPPHLHQGVDAVAIGKCNHKDVCARCCLRLRLCYQDIKCPMCKTELADVVLALSRPDLPDWAYFQSHLDKLAFMPSWARGVGVEDLKVDRRLPYARNLIVALQGMTGIACPVCDPLGLSPLRSNHQLQQHLHTHHRRQACNVCLQANTRFPLELEAYEPAQLRAHLEAAHPVCGCCGKRCSDSDALFTHTQQEHFTCDLCLRRGEFRHFRHASELQAHLRQGHHACNSDRCRQSFVAFSTEMELLSQAQAPPHHQRSASGERPTSRRAQEGLVMIDDDLGTSGAGAFPELNQQQGQGNARDGSQGGVRADDYPQLGPSSSSSASDPHLPDLPRHSRSSRRAAAPAPAPLTTVVVRCECGRKVSRIPVAQGAAQQVQAPACDAQCQRQQRSSRLADAFGVDNPEAHVPWVDRNRTPKYPPELLEFAWHNRAKVLELEKMLGGFLSRPSERRLAMPPQPRALRALVHQLAKEYALTSQSYDSEPRRHIELFRAPAASVPSPLLSQAAAQLTLDEITALSNTTQGFPLHLHDVAPTADLWSLFSQWSGHFTMAPTRGQTSDSATLTFDSAEARSQAVARFGGGLRGLFRIGVVPPASAGAPVRPSGAAPTSAPSASATTAAAKPLASAAAAKVESTRDGAAAVVNGRHPQIVVPHTDVSNQYARLALDEAWGSDSE
ncbi:hypothetical protein WJX73_004439 [Symbiochloris irregularis]|uniref:R3H domain-containing protein n=1 Tax=Symbiochloris irregularis TaxID=706552 RepID=A0AAW1PR79_9CHLO